MRIRSPDHTAAKIVHYRCGQAGKLSGQSLDGPLRHTTFLRSPLGCLSDTVFFARYIGGKLLKTNRMGPHIFLVIGAFSYP